MADENDKEKQPDAAIDITLMKKIQGLIDSGSSENKQKALDLIERDDTGLSGYYVMNFFGSLNYDPDTDVKKRAREICEKKIGPDASKNLETSIEKMKIIQGTFKNLSISTNQISTAFDLSQSIAKAMQHSLTLPIQSINPDFISKCILPQQEMMKNLILPLTLSSNISPILNIAKMIGPIAEMKHPRLTLPELLGRTERDVRGELDAIIDTDEDVVFNVEGYDVLYNLERFLRDLINQRICLKEPKMIGNRIPKEILDSWKERRDEEQKNPFVSGKYDLIDYSDFTDLKMIFEKGKNMQLFLDICSEDQFRGIISKLIELDPIRKKIAHSRPLTKEEFDRLKMYAEDIDRILNRNSNYI